MSSLRGVVIGAGYFSQFHYDAWKRIPGVEIAACCDLDATKAAATAAEYGIPAHYADVEEMLAAVRPDFVDVVTPPPTHLPLVELIAAAQIPIICQKPLAPTIDEARQITEVALRNKSRVMVHENFRFQPWYREIRKLLDQGVLGERLFNFYIDTRLGDGWGDDAYLARQPYFRDMPRLFIYETGIHFVDTLRYLGGEVEHVSAWLRRLNPVIKGEDCGLVVLEFSSGAIGRIDANRFNPSLAENPRYTFGEILVEGELGSLRVSASGDITLQSLDGEIRPHRYEHHERGFAGDCVYFTQRHFVESLINDTPFETDVRDYITNIVIQEAIYQASEQHVRVPVQPLE